jgi:hypothetical protein
MRRRRWSPPNNPTTQAKMLWRAVYGEPWPTGWSVRWVGFMRGASGLCKHSTKTILLSYGDAKRLRTPETMTARYHAALASAFWHYLHDQPLTGHFYARHAAFNRLELERERPQGVIGVLLHEFVHVRHRKLKHGVEFDRLVRWAWDRLNSATL